MTAIQARAAALLSAAAAYVAVYEEQASGLVFEERYEQTVTPLPRGTTVARRLRSEVVVLNTGDLGWVGFRDVFEVDATPIRDRTDRLAKLFAEPLAGALTRARAVADESARFNLGSVERNLNYPTMALMFLRRIHQSRSRFSREGSERVGGVPTWRLRFEEVARPTLIGSRAGDVVASGQFWIEPDSGRVRRSRLTVKELRADGTVEVTYGAWPGLDILMPVSMEERIMVSLGLRVVESIRGTARYSSFKQFRVDLTTSLTVPGGVK